MTVVAVEEDKPKAPETSPDAPPELQSAALTPGKATWTEYQGVIRTAHKVTLELEPDEIHKELVEGEAVPIELVKTDRSRSRAAILNTILIAFGRGDFKFETSDDDIPF